MNKLISSGDNLTLIQLLKNQIIEQEERLYTNQDDLSIRIRNTQLIEATFVKDGRLFISLLRALLFGSILGIFLSFLSARFK